MKKSPSRERSKPKTPHLKPSSSRSSPSRAGLNINSTQPRASDSRKLSPEKRSVAQRVLTRVTTMTEDVREAVQHGLQRSRRVSWNSLSSSSGAAAADKRLSPGSRRSMTSRPGSAGRRSHPVSSSLSLSSFPIGTPRSGRPLTESVFDPRLHVAVGKGLFAEVEGLLSGKLASLDVNQSDYESRTPLHVAVSHGNLPMVELLVSRGADVNYPDTRNRTPLLECSKTEIQDFLKRHGAVDSLKFFAKRAKESEQSRSMESTDVINSTFIRKMVISVLCPILVLLWMSGWRFAVNFLAITIAYYFLIVSYFVSEVSIRPPWYRPNASKLTMAALPEYWQGIVNDPKYDLGLDYEEVTLHTADQYTLSGWYVAASQDSSSRSTGVILVHGGGRDRRAFLRHVRMFHAEGFEVLLFDFREHGMSQGTGKGFTYGVKERYDVCTAARYLRERCGLRTLVAIGTSVGGSACIMAAAVDSNIDIVIAENPITTVGYLQQRHINHIMGGYMTHTWLSQFFFTIFHRLCRLWLNYRVGNVPSKKCQALHTISRIAPRPIFLMHGTADEVVPVEHSQTLFDLAHEPKELWVAPDGFHCGLYDMFPKEFRERVVNFIRRHEK